jgi:hypothetical protein
MENDVKKELDDLNKNLRIIESELTWQLDKLKDYMKRDNENDMESHLKIADINASIELLQEQIKSQAEIFTSSSNKQSSSTGNLKKSIEEVSKTTNLLQQHFEFQKNKLSEYIERDTEFTKQFGDTLRKMRDDMKTITYSKSIVDTLNVASQKDDVDSLKKKDVYRKEKLLHLEKKLENTQNNMKKRVSELEKKIKKLES